MTGNRLAGRFFALLGGLALVGAACGTRVPHDDVVAAAGGAVVSGTTPVSGAANRAAGTGQEGSAGTDGGGAAPQVVGGSPVGPAAPRGNQATPGAGRRQPTLSPIVVGSVGTYSGAPGATLSAGPQALRIWARYVNDRGGIGGHPVQVVVADDRQQAADHRAAVQDLVETRKVVAFVAQIAPFTLDAAKDYLEQKRVPVVGGECSHLAWNQSPMFFPQCAEFRNGIWGSLQVAAKFGKGKRFGLLTCVEAPACTDIKRFYWSEQWVEKAGMIRAYQSDISIAQPDFTAECLRARDADVEVFSLVADVNTVVRVANSCARQDFFPQYLQGGGTTDWRIVGNKAFDGALVKVNVFPHWGIGKTEATREFLEAFRTYAPGLKPTANSSLGWSAAKLFEKVARAAAQRAGTRPLTSAMFLGELWRLRNDTLGGLVTPLTFVRNKVPVPGRCWFMMQIRNQTFTAPIGTRPMCGNAPA
jgi:branched-chain amino acid transport system substrate-binding protein